MSRRLWHMTPAEREWRWKKRGATVEEAARYRKAIEKCRDNPSLESGNELLYIHQVLHAKYGRPYSRPKKRVIERGPCPECGATAYVYHGRKVICGDGCGWRSW